MRFTVVHVPFLHYLLIGNKVFFVNVPVGDSGGQLTGRAGWLNKFRMRMNKFFEGLYAGFLEEMAGIAGEDQSGMGLLVQQMGCIRKCLKRLREYIRQHAFKDEAEEIDFFKRLKPQVYGLRIFYLERYNVETSVPAGDAEMLKSFYREELKTVSRFFERVHFYYRYYRSGATDLDHIYFVRGMEVHSVLIPEVPEQDPDFSTGADYLFSKIRAYELLQDYLLKALKDLDGPSDKVVVAGKELPELKWTGDKINLVEVIYGLYFTGQLNHGNADISVIIRFMEKHLQIDLSRAYRDFIDIRNRKASSPTRYIEQMRESIHKRIDEDLALKKPRREGLNERFK
jgi:hypothetical protein